MLASTPKENIVIDIGNSSIKIGIFSASKLIENHIFHDEVQTQDFLNKRPSASIIISSVGTKYVDFCSNIKSKKIFTLDANTPIPFHNHYKTKNTLGFDRIAAIAGAQVFKNGKNQLIIDIGTCITYDFIDQDNIYHGGGISPGVDLRFKTMHYYTHQLPLVTVYDEADLIGKSTVSALISGVVNGVAAELNGIIDQYQLKFPELQIIVCGGGLYNFESKIKAPIFVAPKLVLIGLNKILEYNEKH